MAATLNTAAPATADSGAARFAALSARLRLGGPIAPDDIRAWCQLALELGQAAEVRHACEGLLAAPAVHPALRPYWLHFLGTALLHQQQIEAGAQAQRLALDALCVAPLVYNPQPSTRRLEDPRAEGALWEALARLAAGGVHAFAHAGTLLGLVREGRLLPFDKDLDLGLPVQELPAARAILQRQGWQPVLQRFAIDNLASYAHPRLEVVLDLCGLCDAPDGDGLLGGFWTGGGSPPARQRVTRFPGPLRLVPQGSPAGPVWGLAEPETWLAAFYGKDWRLPDPNFDTIIGAHNLVGFSALTQWYAYSRITAAWLNGYWEKALRLTGLVLDRHTPEDGLLLHIANHLRSALAALPERA